MNLERLSPAPWRVSDAHGLCVVRDDPIGDVVADLSVGQWVGNRADAEFIALARNAFDVMMRRRWHQEPLSNGKWLVCENRNGDWCDGPTCDDPFTALVEADRWYRENVENRK
jgi:hypothetical protein